MWILAVLCIISSHGLLCEYSRYSALYHHTVFCINTISWYSASYHYMVFCLNIISPYSMLDSIEKSCKYIFVAFIGNDSRLLDSNTTQNKAAFKTEWAKRIKVMGFYAPAVWPCLQCPISGQSPGPRRLSPYGQYMPRRLRAATHSITSMSTSRTLCHHPTNPSW